MWRPGHRPTLPLTADQRLRNQLTASVSAIDNPNEYVDNCNENFRAAWHAQLEKRHLETQAAEKRRQLNREDETDVLDAQLDAVAVMTSGKAFVNAVDRATLLRLLSEMHKIGSPLEASPLANPVINLGERGPSLFAIRPKRAGEGVMDSGSSNAEIDRVVSRTITFAHRRAQRLKDQQQERQRQRQRAAHRAPPKPPPGLSDLAAAAKTPPPRWAAADLAAAAKSPPQRWPLPRAPSEVHTRPLSAPSPSTSAASPPLTAARRAPQLLLGLRWWLVGTEMPEGKTALVDEALSKALEQKMLPADNKVVFTRVEYAAFTSLPELRADHVIRAGPNYFSATAPPPEVTKASLHAPSSWRATLKDPGPPVTQEQLKRDFFIEKRMASRYSLGLCQRLLVDQHVQEKIRREARDAKLERVLEAKRVALEEKAAALVEKHRKSSVNILTDPAELSTQVDDPSA